MRYYMFYLGYVVIVCTCMIQVRHDYIIDQRLLADSSGTQDSSR